MHVCPLSVQVKAVLCGALSPNVAVMSEASPPHGPPIWTTGAGTGPGAGEEVVLHPTCCSAPLTTPQFKQSFLVYLEKVSMARRGQMERILLTLLFVYCKQL